MCIPRAAATNVRMAGWAPIRPKTKCGKRAVVVPVHYVPVSFESHNFMVPARRPALRT